MELFLSAIHVVFRFLVWVGLGRLFVRSEAWIHRRLFPKRLREAVGDNSDLMHGITILFWMLVVGIALFAIVLFQPVIEFVNNYLNIDYCLDSGGEWSYEKHICER